MQEPAYLRAMISIISFGFRSFAARSYMPSPQTPPNPAQQETTTVPPSTERLWTRASILTVVALGVAAAILRFAFLARKPFWFDECFSVEVARLSPHDFARLLWRREANMSLYYFFLRGWLHWGSSPVVIRSLSVIFSLAVLPAIYWLAAKLFDRHVALLSVALVSVNAYQIRYAQEARSYSLFVLLAILSSGFFVATQQRASRRNRWGYIVCSVLAVYAHLYAVLLVAAQWLSVRRIGKTQTGLRGNALRKAWIWIAAFAAPLLIFAAKTGAGPIRWIPRPGIRDVLHFAEQLAGNDGLPLLLLYMGAWAFAVFGREAIREPVVEGDDWQRWRLRFLLIWLMFPVALILLFSLARPLFLGRYFIFCSPALIILAAAGLAKLPNRWLRAAVFGAMLLLSVHGTVSYYHHDFDLERDDSNGSTNYILDHARAGDVILFHIAEARVPYEFFKTVREEAARAPEIAPEVVYSRHGERLDYRDFSGKPGVELVDSISDRRSRVWLVLMSNSLRGQPDPTTLMLDQKLGSAFPQVDRAEFTEVEVRLYSRP
jgi:mannosyltransferase